MEEVLAEIVDLRVFPNQDDVVPVVNYKNALAAFKDTGKVKYIGDYIYGDDNGTIKMGKHSSEGRWFYGKFIAITRSFKNVKK